MSSEGARACQNVFAHLSHIIGLIPFRQTQSLKTCVCLFYAMKKKFHWSVEWREKRTKILRRDNYRDQWEARFGRNVNADTVHHIFPVEWFPQYKLASWNLISLSTKTHNMMHDRATGALTEAGMTLADRVARKYERWDDLDKLKELNDYLAG